LEYWGGMEIQPFLWQWNKLIMRFSFIQYTPWLHWIHTCIQFNQSNPFPKLPTVIVTATSLILILNPSNNLQPHDFDKRLCSLQNEEQVLNLIPIPFASITNQHYCVWTLHSNIMLLDRKYNNCVSRVCMHS